MYMMSSSECARPQLDPWIWRQSRLTGDVRKTSENLKARAYNLDAKNDTGEQVLVHGVLRGNSASYDRERGFVRCSLGKPKNVNGSDPGICTLQKTVLLVDDDASIRAVVTHDLKDHYKVLIADSGLEALRRSRDFAGEIHLLLTDLQLGGMNGIDLAIQITVQRPETKVLLMSCSTDGMLPLKEGWHFLAKPFIPSQLLTVIAGLVCPVKY